jgi:hypothetical protein
MSEVYEKEIQAIRQLLAHTRVHTPRIVAALQLIEEESHELSIRLADLARVVDGEALHFIGGYGVTRMIEIRRASALLSSVANFAHWELKSDEQTRALANSVLNASFPSLKLVG